MDVIKKKMQAMKIEKDNAMDKADTCEGQAKEANMRADKVLEEVADLTKKLTQVEGDLEANKQALEQANKDLEDREKSLTNVSLYFRVFFCTVSRIVLIFHTMNNQNRTKKIDNIKSILNENSDLCAFNSFRPSPK